MVRHRIRTAGTRLQAIILEGRYMVYVTHMPNGIRLPIAKSMAFVVIFSCSSHASYVYTCVETHRDALQTRIMYVHITIRVFLHKMLYIYI